MKAINPNIYPSGGYWFQDPDGTKHVGDSWAGVIARVKYYRQRKGSPASNIAQEVIDQACSRTPSICTESNPANEAQLRYVSLKSRVLLWLNKMRESKEPRTFAEFSLREARTDVCLRCPRHQALPGGCGACLDALKALKESIVGTRPNDIRLQACSVTGEYLPVAAWLEQQAIVNDELPPECWRKRTL